MPEESNFQVSENTIRAQTALEVTLEENVKRTAKATALQCKQEQLNVNLPLIGMMKQWMHLLIGDVLRFVHLQQEDGPEVVVGIPDEDVEAYIATLDSILDDVEKVREAVEPKGKVGTIVAEATLRIKTRCAELAAALSEAALGDILEGDDDDEDFVIDDEDDDDGLISDGEEK
ncbi:MAG: hypothetical protein NWE76_09805 [Candidatus Bathyarchaeota archaeon]|nr:hypothetical protein [Candidatus Bathyarchaeota archaeon]